MDKSQSSNSQFVRGPHAADSDIPPDARRDGAWIALHPPPPTTVDEADTVFDNK